MDLKQTRKMDLLQYLVYSTVAVLVFVKDLHADISVTTTINPVGLLGNNDVELVCTYNLASVDTIYSIAWTRETSKDSGSYEQIAGFLPPGSSQAPATLFNLTNPSVFGRVVLTNPTDSSLTAKIRFTSVVCDDERKYQCTVLGLNNGAQINPIPASITSLTVKAKPNATAFNEVAVNPASNIEEGQTVTFTCTGNVGRPAGSFSWTRYKDTTNSIGTPIASTTQTSSSTDCTFAGSSVISIQMTKDDNGVIVKCALVHETITDSTDTAYYKLTNVINVFYKVRAPTITKSPNAAVHYEDTDLTLTCAAEGYPAPMYVWRVNGTQVGTGAQLQLTDIKIAQSGDYVCEATNDFNGNTYNMSSTVTITIETPPTTIPTTTTPVPSVEPTNGGGTQAPQGEDEPSGPSTTIIIVIVVVVVVVIVIVAVIAFICLKRRNANKSIEEPPEKPRNNSDLSFVNKPPDVIRNDEKRGNNMGFNNFDKPKGELQYADLTFDDRPRSRRPIQILDSDLGPTTYSEVTMPSV